MKKIIHSVLILCNYSSKYGGNFIASLKSFALYAKSNNKNVIFCFPILAKGKEWIKWLSNDCEVIFFDELKDVIAISKINKIDCLYTHFLSIKQIAYLRAKTNISIVSHIHSDFSNGNKISIRNRIKCFFGYFLTFGVKFILVSKHFKNIPHKKRQFVVLNALSCNRESSVDTRTNVTKQDFGFTSSDIVIEMFGWSPYTKGVDIALKSFAQVSNKSTNRMKLLIITDENDKTVSFVKQNKLDCNSVVFASPRNNVFEFHNVADVFLSSSRSEGFSYAALEALSLGKTCILSDIDGTSWAKKYENTYFYPSGNIIELSNLLEQIQEGKIDITINNNVSSKIIKDFSIDDWCAKIYRIIYENA